MTEQQQVTEFMRAAGQDCPEYLTAPTAEVAHLRYSLIHEELNELYEALGFPTKAGDKFHFVNEPDAVLTADAIADLLYVVLGTATAIGLDITPIFQEVHRSNMTKFIDGHRRADGKWIKGPSYEPANIQPILALQCNTAPVVEDTPSQAKPETQQEK